MTPAPAIESRLTACGCCGLVQRLPASRPGLAAHCVRCDRRLHSRLASWRSNSRTASIATAALILYPPAVTLPIMEIRQFGHAHETSIIEGVVTLFASGHLFVGIVVLLCSIILPLGKLLALVALTWGGLGLERRHQALTYRIVEFTGRWGMLDVTLVAVLVAALKLGDMVEVTPGPAALAFTSVVLLSLIAATFFNPQRLWDDPPVEES